MRIDEIGVFVRVFEAGSFAAAARAMGMPKATVSAKVAALEERLGVTLIQRTTRSLRPTPAGELYFERCRRGLAEIEAAELALAAEVDQPMGTLRLTAPAAMCEGMVPSLLGSFLERYPALKAEVVVTNRELDLVAEGIDLAFRIGPMRDSSYLSRLFVPGGGSFYASEGYIKRHGAPETLEELRSHPFVAIARGSLPMVRGVDAVDIAIEPMVVCNDFHMVRAVIETGTAIGYLPDVMASGRKAPRLRRILPDYHKLGTINFVYPNQPFVPARVRHFIAHAFERASEWGG